VAVHFAAAQGLERRKKGQTQPADTFFHFVFVKHIFILGLGMDSLVHSLCN